MIIKNGKTISSVIKGSQVIDKIMKGTLVVYESWRNLIASGVPPLTLLNCKGVDLVDYKIYGDSKQGRLPSNYQEVEYIESTGTQYINTGLVGKTGYTIETDISFTQLATGSYQYFTGYSYTGSADRIYFIRINNTSNYLGYTYGSDAQSRLLLIEENTFYNIKSTMKAKYQELIVDGNSIGTSGNADWPCGRTCGGRIGV